ncbi:helix-turn-helix domain-containing protein [Sorangium sp. So ce385]|uniref:SEC-C domain-containing protein n=1 Tax=Sorangium sp. So ce385 TaxID=3133308 RepID=UPI003F5BABB5
MRDGAYRIRCLILLRLDAGATPASIAEQLQVARSTISRVRSRFLAEGLAGLRDHRAHNGQRKVSAAHRRRLEQLLDASPRDFGWAPGFGAGDQLSGHARHPTAPNRAPAQRRDNFPHMPKVPQTRRELEQQLDEHVAFLKDSAEAYDSGKTHEAKRLAASMRVLLHDTPNSHSLLGQLGKKTIAILDTAGEIDPENLLPESLLTMLWSGDLSNYLPKLDELHDHRSFVPFEQWWKATVIDDRCGNVLSHKDLVLIMANQDGGAHVDPGVDSKYHRISRQFAMKLTAHHMETGASDFVRLVERASVRQIAHELLKTLDPSYGCNNRLSTSFAHDYVEINFTVPAPPKIIETDPCPCGSGRSFKECHGTL